MALRFTSTHALCLAVVLTLAAATALRADDSADLRQQIQLLKEQNATLKQQLDQQRTLIDGLTTKVTEIQQTKSRNEAELESAAPAPSPSLSLGNVHLSGQGAVGFFDTGSEGTAPNSEFRIHEASLFVEAPVWDNVYFFGELYLAQYESSDLDVRVGEMYVDFEDVSQLWGRDRQLNLRIGRLNLPFGEEYLHRDAIDNALISHSVIDLWGVDEGVELYGSLGPVSYVVAVQNGGVSLTRDFDADKSVAARVSYDPTHWLHLSLSGMRTGDLNAQSDYLSELWFSGGWFLPIGSPETTAFHADLVQIDAELKFKRGYLRAFGGYANYDDNDPNQNNQRGLYYYSLEGLCRVTKKFYVVTRFSQILVVNDSYPLTGNGTMGEYLFNPDTDEWAKSLWRLSLGLGWRFSDRLVAKAEYSFERGEEAGGETRDQVDLFAVEAAFKF